MYNCVKIIMKISMIFESENAVEQPNKIMNYV